MKIAHVRELHAPAGASWRLAAALGPGERPARWLDLEVARRRAVGADQGLAHNSLLHRTPITTLDAHLAAGMRVEALAELVGSFVPRAGPDDDEEDDAVLAASGLRFGPPILQPPS